MYLAVAPSASASLLEEHRQVGLQAQRFVYLLSWWDTKSGRMNDHTVKGYGALPRFL